MTEFSLLKVWAHYVFSSCTSTFGQNLFYLSVIWGWSGRLSGCSDQINGSEKIH